MAERLPTVDARRASKLREALGRNARMLAPDWAGVAQEGDFGRALLEIAARLAEHSTSRLDATPLRDKLAFLDALDVATPAPQSATAPIVFTLAERRDTKVSAPARVQLTADVGDEEITFETRAAIDISPARIGNLVMADPASDWIERAPPFVTRSVDEIDPPTRYRLLSAVEASATTIQLVQGVGIKPGDLLRLAGGVYRVEKEKDGIVQLLDKLGQPAPAGANVDKLIALESFALRNLQQHVVYFGHKEMLKLDGPAAITLVFDPPTLPAVLAGLDLEYEIWGSSDEEEEEEDKKPGWRRLELLGAGPAGLMLGKTWNGSVDELELAAGKSRWVRIRLNSPIEGACGPPTGTTSVELKVRSTKPDNDKDGEGSETIGAAFYNSQPLPTSTSFLPFGPEPQRFDIFSLSAPEALSKKGATVTLDVTMVGANLQSMTSVAGGPGHVYGVSSKGRLQSVDLEGSAASWRQLGLAPPPEAGSDAAGSAGTIRLNATVPLAAVRVPSNSNQEIVFVCDVNNRLMRARIDKVGNDWTLHNWNEVPPPAQDQQLIAFCLLPPAAGVGDHRLLAVYPAGIYARAINANGVVAGWEQVGSNPPGEAPRAIAVGSAEPGRVVLALIDNKGQIHRGDLTNGPDLQWTRFAVVPAVDPAEQPAADPTVQPTAFLDKDGKLVVVAARAKPANADVLFVAHEEDAEWPIPLDPDDKIGAVKSISGLTKELDANLDKTLILISGRQGMLKWTISRSTKPQKDDYTVRPLPAEVDGESAYALLLPSVGTSSTPRLLLNGTGERLLIWPRITGAKADLHDILRHEPGELPTHFMVRGTAAPSPLEGPWVRVGPRKEVHAAPAALISGTKYVLLQEVEEDFSGNAVSSHDDRLQLDGDDNQTKEDDFLRIGPKFYEVKDVLPGSPRIAILDADLAGSTDYRLFKLTDSNQVIDRDLARLATVAGQLLARQLLFEAPASPLVQPVGGRASAAGTTAFYLATEWSQAPSNLTGVPVTLAGEIGTAGESATISLPRNADNPALSWEYHDGKGWRRLDRWSFADGTGNLAGSGEISFTVPTDLNPTEIAGKEDYWIRARLTGGDYGRPTYDIVSEPPIQANPPATSRSKTSITIDRSELNPPEIQSIEARYVVHTAVTPDFVVADNNLAAIDQTQAALADGAVFNLFEGVAQHVGDEGAGTRALYIGLTKRPDVQALTLYADILDQNHDRRELVAEVLTAGGWKQIGVDDNTAGLARPGMIQPILVPPPEQLPLFGRDGWWLRLRPKEAAADWAPIIRGLFVNAVMAAHAKTVSDELLGSSLGEPKQRYFLAQKPVLPDTLELRVLESLGEEERTAVEAAFGKGAVREDDLQRGQWVQWREVPTFVDEDGDARVFRLDPASGEVMFGNGRCGKIPPARADSIRAFNYQWGGGSTGNVPARAIANLSSAIESVELAMNPAEAAGGADAPAAERLAITAPTLLRHAGKALAPVDVEAIATGSAPDVVRARCLPRRGCTIEVVVAIRDTGQHCPVPSRERREGIARNILAAGWGPLAPESVTVRAPRYVPARVDAEVIAQNAEAIAGVEQQIRTRLVQFLHPVEGGPEGLGWPFGRRIWASDLQRAIAGVAGLDRIVGVRIEAKAQGDDLAAMPLDGLVCVDDADLIVVVRPPEDER